LIRYMPVNATSPALNSNREGFIAAYQQAFGGPPYFEHYTPEEVLEEVWTPHVNDGIVVLATDDQTGQVVGFGCAMPALKSPPEVTEYLIQHLGQDGFPTDLTKLWYMSELGVVESYRRRGIAYELVRHRMLTISHRGDTHYAFRTAAEGSNSIHLYLKIGATQLPDLQDMTETGQVVVNGSQSDHRVYLFGDCESALQELRTAGH
jgi:GNAT superfamily N-acetyltransferase